MKKYIFIVIILLFSTFISGFSQEDPRYKLAKSYETGGDMQSAARIYKELYDSQTNSIKYFKALSDSYLALNKYSELLPIAEDFSARNPGYENYSMLASLYWSLGNIDKAEEFWEKALDDFPNNSKKYTAVFKSQINIRLKDKAVETIRRARKDLNNENLYLNEMIQIFSSSKDYKNGMKEILNYFYKTMDLSRTQGWLYTFADSPEASKYINEILNQEIEKNDGNIKLLNLYTFFLRSTGDYKGAFEVVKKLDKLQMTKGREVLYFSDQSRRAGKYQIALDGYKYIIDNIKSSQYLNSALFGYARAMEQFHEQKGSMSKEQASKLISSYEDIIEKFPHNAYANKARYRIAEISINVMSDLKRAGKELRQLAIKSRGREDAANALLLLGDVYLMESDMDKADSAYREVKKIYWRNFKEQTLEAQYKLAETQFYRGNIDTAQSLFLIVSKESKSKIANDALIRYGMIEQNKQFERALRLIGEADFALLKNEIEVAVEKYLSAAKLTAGEDISDKTYIKVAELLIEKKNFERAIEILSELEKENPESFNLDYVHLLKAKTYELLDNFVEAEKSYMNILQNFGRSIHIQEARDKVRALRDRKIKK